MKCVGVCEIVVVLRRLWYCGVAVVGYSSRRFGLLF